MAWWKYAKPGDKVVCVRSSADYPYGTPFWKRPFIAKSGVIEGRIYTISSIFSAHNVRSFISKSWVEIGSPIAIMLKERDPTMAYNANIFRPLRHQAISDLIEQSVNSPVDPDAIPEADKSNIVSAGTGNQSQNGRP